MAVGATSQLDSGKGSESQIKIPHLRHSWTSGDVNHGIPAGDGQNGDNSHAGDRGSQVLPQESSNRTLEGSSSEHRQNGKNQAKSKQNPIGPDQGSLSEERANMKSPVPASKAHLDVSPLLAKTDINELEADFEPKHLDSALTKKELVLPDLETSVRKVQRSPNEMGSTHSLQFNFKGVASSSPVTNSNNPDRKSVSEKQIISGATPGTLGVPGAPSRFSGLGGLVINPQKVSGSDGPDDLDSSPTHKQPAGGFSSKRKLQPSVSFDGNIEALVAEKKEHHKKRLISYIMEFDSIASTTASDRARNKQSGLLSECIFI